MESLSKKRSSGLDYGGPEVAWQKGAPLGLLKFAIISKIDLVILNSLSLELDRKKVIGMEDKILQAIEGLKNDFNLKSDSLTNKFDALSEKVDNQGNQIKENTQILKALEHLAQVNKAEHDKMSFNIAEISGEIKAIRKDLSNVEIITASNWGDIAKIKSVI